MLLNDKKVNVRTLEVDGVDRRDFGDFCDAYFSYAEYADGTVLNDSELEELGMEYSDTLNELAMQACMDSYCFEADMAD